MPPLFLKTRPHICEVPCVPLSLATHRPAAVSSEVVPRRGRAIWSDSTTGRRLPPAVGVEGRRARPAHGARAGRVAAVRVVGPPLVAGHVHVGVVGDHPVVGVAPRVVDPGGGCAPPAADSGERAASHSPARGWLGLDPGP